MKELREEQGISQAALAEKAQVSRTIISGLENETIEVTSTKTLSKLANALNKKVSELFFE